MTASTIGIDISKDHLDAYRTSDGASRRFANDKTGHRALSVWIGGEAERVVFEPTGPYHRAFERALAKAGRQARQGQPPSGAPLRGGDWQAWPKTDRLGAALLARMGALLALEARPAASLCWPNSRSCMSPARRWSGTARPQGTAPKL